MRGFLEKNENSLKPGLKVKKEILKILEKTLIRRLNNPRKRNYILKKTKTLLNQVVRENPGADAEQLAKIIEQRLERAGVRDSRLRGASLKFSDKSKERSSFFLRDHDSFRLSPPLAGLGRPFSKKAPSFSGLVFIVSFILFSMIYFRLQALPGILEVIEQTGAADAQRVKERSDLILVASSVVLPTTLIIYKNKQRELEQEIKKAAKMHIGRAPSSLRVKTEKLEKVKSRKLNTWAGLIRLLTGLAAALYALNAVMPIYSIAG